MTVYSHVQSTIDGLDIGEMITISVPDKLRAFRKFLSEISLKDHKKFTTKVIGSQMHILRVNYYSVAAKIESE